MRRAGVVAVAAAAAVCAGCADALAQAQAAPEYRCPASSLSEVRREPLLPGLITALIPPFNVFNFLARDPLAKAPTRPVAFRVVDEASKPVANALIGLIYREESRFIAEGASGGPAVAIPHGAYVVNAAVRSKDGAVRWGSAEATVDASGPATVLVTLRYTLPAATARMVSVSGVAGFRAPVALAGLVQEHATLVVVRPGADARSGPKEGLDQVLSEAPVEAAKPPAVLLPGTPGKYEVIYTLCAPRIMLARTPVTVTPARVTLVAPERAPMGSVMRVVLRGTLSSAYTLKLKHDQTGAAHDEQLTDAPEQSVDLHLPFVPGLYDLTVRTHDEVMLAHRTFSVASVPVPLTGPDSVGLGRPAEFAWPAESGSTFRLELWSLAGKGRKAERVAQLDRGNERIVAPAGEYELRLVPSAFDDKRVVTRKPLRIEGRAFDDPPREVTAGSRVTVKLLLPGEFFDRAGFVARGAKSENLWDGDYPRNGHSVTLRAPAKPGSYDLVFMLGTVGARVDVERVPVEVK